MKIETFLFVGWSQCTRFVRGSERWAQSIITPRGPLGRNFGETGESWRENWTFLSFLIIPAEGTRSYEVPRHPECGDSSEVFTLQRNQTRQHQRRGHCRRQPQAYTRPHMDHHPSLPGRRLSSHPQQTPLTPPHFV